MNHRMSSFLDNFFTTTTSFAITDSISITILCLIVCTCYVCTSVTVCDFCCLWLLLTYSYLLLHSPAYLFLLTYSLTYLLPILCTTGNIEDWLCDLLKKMQLTMKDLARSCSHDVILVQTDLSQLRTFIDHYISQFALLGEFFILFLFRYFFWFFHYPAIFTILFIVELRIALYNEIAFPLCHLVCPPCLLLLFS